jgi:hypothetical protein
MDVSEYQKLIRESLTLRNTSALQREPAHQFRECVQKDIWTIHANQRLHYRLKSKHSNLTIRQKKGTVEAVELLQNIEGCLQEEVTEEGEQIRYLFAREGTYFFPSHQFIAEEVDLYFFSLPEKELPSCWPTITPFLRGTANEVVFSAENGFPAFTAYHLNAQFDVEL